MQKTEAIVIYSFPFKDKKFMLEVFTREHGRMAFVTNKRLQPLSIMDLVFDEKRSKLQSADFALAYKTLQYDPFKLSISFFVAEFLRYSTRNEPKNQSLYDYVRQSLEWLDLVDGDFANYHLVLMMRIAQFLGFAPDLEGYRDGMLFDLRDGQFVSVHPMHKDVLGGVESAQFFNLMRMSIANMHLFKLNKDQRNAILDRIIQYYRLHVPSFPEMKSVDVLRELF